MADETKVTKSPTPAAPNERGARAVRVGEVVSSKMDKTVVIKITRTVPHPVYSRFVKKSSKLHAHDEENTANVGDTVRVVSTRPLSKQKRWRLVEVIERAK